MLYTCVFSPDPMGLIMNPMGFTANPMGLYVNPMGFYNEYCFIKLFILCLYLYVDAIEKTVQEESHPKRKKHNVEKGINLSFFV